MLKSKVLGLIALHMLVSPMFKVVLAAALDPEA
jgi:hypothetical protein